MAASGGGRPLLGHAQRLALRLGSGRAGRLWPRLYGGVERGLALLLLRGLDGSAYVRGGTGRDQPLWGVSDIDLICVVAGDPIGRGAARERVLGRWRRLRRRIPQIDALVSVGVYEDDDLAEAVADTYLTHGLGTPSDAPTQRRALYYPGRPGSDDAWLRARPGLFGPMADWRLVAGDDRRPPAPEQDDGRARIAAWGDLQHWWLYAFERACDPRHPTTAYLAAKLIVEPVRIMLWLDERRAIWRRPEVISIGLERYPEHERDLQFARSLIADPLRLERDGGAQERALTEALPRFVRLSDAVAERLERGIGERRLAVRLLGSGAELVPPPGQDWTRLGAPLPLCDWRGLCVRSWPDEALVPVGAESTVSGLAGAIADSSGGAQPVIRSGSLLIMPAPQGRSQIRRVASALTDPISTAVIAGRAKAQFAYVRGFSATDWARRAVAERAAQLEARDSSGDGPRDRARLGLLFSGARAALFALSLAQEREPELALTAAAAARALSAREPQRSPAIEACLVACSDPATEPEPVAAAELERLVAGSLSQARDALEQTAGR